MEAANLIGYYLVVLYLGCLLLVGFVYFWLNSIYAANNQINRDHHELRPKKQASAHGVTLLNRYVSKEY